MSLQPHKNINFTKPPGFASVFAAPCRPEQLETLRLLLGADGMPDGPISLGDARLLMRHALKMRAARQVELREEMSNRPHDPPRYEAEETA